jgi:hypothetical protein
MTPKQAQRRANELGRVVYLSTVYSPYLDEYVNLISPAIMARAIIVTSYKPNLISRIRHLI